MRSNLADRVRRTLAAATALAVTLALPVAATADIAGPLNQEGEKLVYLVTGVQNDETGDDETVTLFACTNVGPDDLEVTVEVCDASGDPVAADTTVLSPGETEAWETSESRIGDDTQELAVPSFNGHGSARILALGKKPQLVCTAWVMDGRSGADEPGMQMALPVVPQAKEPKLKPAKDPGSGAGLSASIDADETLRYAITGVQYDSNGDDEMATVIACANLGDDSAEVRVEIFDEDAKLDASATTVVGPRSTRAFESQNVRTQSGAIDLDAPSEADIGSARVIAVGKKVQLACIAYVIDPDAGEAKASMHLPVFFVGKKLKAKPREN